VPRFHADEPAASSPTSTDGWGDAQEQASPNDDDEKDGWGDMDLPAEPAPAPALARIHAAQQKPITTQKKPIATATSTTTRIVTKPSEFRLFSVFFFFFFFFF
jgi:SCY1-like protein 1